MGEGGLSPRRAAVQRSLAGIATDEFRPDVEGLRAVAVVAVVLFHMRLSAFSGGFVGVDVFFVLSGFLITRLLLRELATTGSLSLPRFWARRARRLLPASALVVLVTVVAAHSMLPPVGLHSLSIDVLAAATFVINFVFAHRLGDYFGAQLGQQSPSPLLHFWSLAVEEQFYLLWPATMLLATRRPRQYRRLLVIVMLAIAGASLIASIWMTNHQPTQAFYLLPARMGELLAGGLVAIGEHSLRSIAARWRATVAWLGMLGIVVAVLSYDGAMAFPGTAILIPVLATVLLIVGGGRGTAVWAPARFLSTPPLQWIGRHSYAIYLWHWPALVLSEAKWGPLSLAQRVLVVAVSVGLSAISVRLIENPVRHSPWLASWPRRGLVMGGGICLTLVVTGCISLGTIPRLDSGTAAAAPTLPSLPHDSTASTAPGTTLPGDTVPANLNGNDLASLIAANQQVLAQGMSTQEVPSNMRPALGSVFNDRPNVYHDGCVAIGVDDSLTPCRYGKKGARTKVVLYGDSHAAQWSPALEQLADERGFELIVLAKGGCPTAAVSIPTNTLSRTCPIWRDKAIAFIATQHPTLVIVTASSHYPNSADEWSRGLDATIARLTPIATRVLVLGDNPGAKTDPAACLSAHIRSVPTCTRTRDSAVNEGRVAVESAVSTARHVHFVDTTDWFCTPTACPVIIGNILIFRDINHITTIAATWYEPLVAAIVGPLLN